MGDPVEIDTDRLWEDQRSTYDALRSGGAVAREEGAWVVLRHAEVVAAATDPHTFSSRVTTRRAIPNSLDGADHASYRAVVDRYLTEKRVAREEAQCRDGRPLAEDEIVSILRNWTAGDLGSLATSVGVIVHFLAAAPAIQQEVRTLVEADDRAALSAAVEEILRIDDPFVSNRRVATRQF